MKNTGTAVTDAGNAPRVIFLVTFEFLKDEAGFSYLTKDGFWTNEHDDGLQFSSEIEARQVADKLGASVLCSAT